MLFRLFAHAAEFHTEEASDIQHILTEWWFGLGAYALFIYLIGWGLKGRLSLATRLSLILAVSLVLALVFYRWTPILSGVAIVIGFGLSLFLGLGGARGGK